MDKLSDISLIGHVQPFVKTKSYAVIAAVLVVILSLLLIGVTDQGALSAVRSYVGGEDVWSKGQAEAAYELERYIRTGDEADYEAFLLGIAAPLSIKRARLELEKSDPHVDEIRRGFTEGGIDAAEADFTHSICPKRSEEHVQAQRA